jgi:hypothetical protein
MNYRILPIPAEISEKVRQTMVSPQYKSLAAAASVANGYGPCRSCLRVFNQGADRRIFFTYNSFEGFSKLPDPGPVFIHANECESFEGRFPEDILDLPVFFEAFGDDSRMIERERMERDQVDEQVTRLLSMPGVRFVNLRNAEAGCYIAKALPAE